MKLGESMNQKIALVGFGVFAFAGFIIGMQMPFEPILNSLGHLVLMALLITVGFWIFKPGGISYTASGAFFMAMLLSFGMKPSQVFSGFTSPAVWSLIPALFFGFVLAKTGLGKRIAYFGMKKARLSYPGILVIWVAIGIVLSMLTPSITVRVVIMIPIALNCVDLCQLKPGSKGRSLILLTALGMALIPGTAWPSGSLAGPIISGLFSGVEGLRPITFFSWVQVAMMPMALISLIMVVGGYFVLRPEESLQVSRKTFEEEYEKLGKIKREEQITGILLIITFFLLATSSLHKIPDAAICLTAFFLLVVFKIIQTPEISSGISWDLVVFNGIAMSMSTVFQASGVSKWLSIVLVPLFEPLEGSPLLFSVVVLIGLFLWRFIDIALLIPTMAILVTILPEISAVAGVDPIIFVPLFCISLNAFFMSYQNMFALVAEANMQGRGWTATHLLRYGTLYFIAGIISVSVAVPYWESSGLFR